MELGRRVHFYGGAQCGPRFFIGGLEVLPAALSVTSEYRIEK